MTDHNISLCRIYGQFCPIFCKMAKAMSENHRVFSEPRVALKSDHYTVTRDFYVSIRSCFPCGSAHLLYYDRLFGPLKRMAWRRFSALLSGMRSTGFPFRKSGVIKCVLGWRSLSNRHSYHFIERKFDVYLCPGAVSHEDIAQAYIRNHRGICSP